MFDALARVAPTHYYDVMARFEQLRTRVSQRPAAPLASQRGAGLLD